ncbi:MAG: sigma-70 family RNA polymerase sigma factor [Victivallaceae bacterium]|nr:sigma-70 family RNA polymerase sigma factor [Victivallaceae bacterium]
MPIYPETNRTMLEKIIAGDDVSWSEFYDAYAPVVRSLCRIARVPEEKIDDVIQETMFRFSDRSKNFVYAPEKARFRTYFNKVVHGGIADCFRKIARDKALPVENLPGEADLSAEEKELDVWRHAVLDQALAELAKRVSAKNYLAFTMSAFDGKSIADTAEFLRISADQVYLARNRCAAILKEIVKKCNDADPDLNLSAPEL